MDIHRTEEEQIEAIKKWWQENGKQTVSLVLVVLAIYFGWHTWQKNVDANTEAASAMYQEMLDALDAQQDGQKDVQLQTAMHLGETLRKEHASSIYAVNAALISAKLAVEQNDLAKSESELRWAMDNSDDASLESLARLRLAQVKFAAGMADEALTMLESGNAGIYQASYEELKGDIHLDKGDTEKARLSYQAAVNLRREAGEQVSRLLEIKLEGISEPDSSKIFDLPEVLKKKANNTSADENSDAGSKVGQ